MLDNGISAVGVPKQHSMDTKIVCASPFELDERTIQTTKRESSLAQAFNVPGCKPDEGGSNNNIDKRRSTSDPVHLELLTITKVLRAAVGTKVEQNPESTTKVTSLRDRVAYGVVQILA